MSDNAALTVDGLSFAYGKQAVLQDVRFSVPFGQCTVLLGPNGAGKSTLFALITRLYDAPEGRIEICGFDIKKYSCKALAKLGVVFQQSTLDMDLTVLQNLNYHAALHGMSGKLAKARIREELERLDMYERCDEKLRQLNGGHRRRVEIARALMHKPALLLLDEPTVGLDVHSRQSIVEYVHKLTADSRLGVLWASHLIDEIHSEDHLIVLHQGRIRAQGSVSTVLQETQCESIQTAFFKLTQRGAQL